jgi:hypothetical protein
VAGISVAVVFVVIVAPGVWLTQQSVNEAGKGLDTIAVS